ncbi:hypothetical protein [Parasitella parasitica]|uniref:TRIP4/RQT4 C2HC5-type zinc finger domain-containing protein n=1 Tax=Parasitella parasitica TaxID=35722 RepID=A0A0B7MVJ8_9FUNG|nr:hypothetical protein [Parasitella parasitica]
MSLESWAIDKLSVFLGFDPETLQSQILPYLLTSESPDAFAEQLMDLVGTSDEALAFIQEFTKRRFNAKQAPEQSKAPLNPKPKPSAATSSVKASATSSSSISSIPNTQSEGTFPSLPSNQQPYDTMWPANISVHQKKEDEYFAGLRKNKRSKNKNNELRAAAFPPESKPASTTAPKKEKKASKKEMTLEAALKELDIKAETPGKKRKPCQCQATKHPLLTAAPNCLSCGKIICTAEGVGPCSFCGSPVLSKDQQIALIAEAKKKRAEQKQAQNQPSKRAPKSGQTGMNSAYASKLGGGGGGVGSYNSSPYQSSEDDDSRLKAERHKEKLLEFQRTSAQRSTIIDQATDFELPTDQTNPWLTPQERALMIKKQQSNLRRIEQKGNSNRHKVMTIDVQTRQVRVQDADSSSSSSSEEEDSEDAKAVTKMDLSKKKSTTDDGSAGTYAYNPLLKGIEAPKFIGKSTKKTRGQLRRKERVQYDVDDIMNDYMFASSVQDDDTIDPVNEPITCG